MAFADRVWETTTGTGTGPLTMAGAVTGYRTFLSAFGNGGVPYYAIVGGSEWEIGLGSIATGGILTRTTVYSSSNANASVNFSAGVKNVYCVIPSKAIAGVMLDASNNPVFKSGGTSSATGFQIANGTDLASVFNFGFTTAAANRATAAAGSGAGVYKSYTLEQGASTTQVRLVETQVNFAIGFCSYCSYCTYCGYCSYCTYCTYCNCACNCACDCY